MKKKLKKILWAQKNEAKFCFCLVFYCEAGEPPAFHIYLAGGTPALHLILFCLQDEPILFTLLYQDVLAVEEVGVVQYQVGVRDFFLVDGDCVFFDAAATFALGGETLGAFCQEVKDADAIFEFGGGD